jgi:iron complex transport system permease protein
MNSGIELKSVESGEAVEKVDTAKTPKGGWTLLILGLLVVGLFFTSCAVGRYAISFSDLGRIFLAKLFGLKMTGSPAMETVLFAVRLPRIGAALMIGGALALAGGTYQGLFKNPMVSPDILGASAGAGFGAAVAILCSFNVVGIQIVSFCCGLGAVLLTFLISKSIGRSNNPLLVLVLTGMVVSTLFSSFISMTKYVADPDSKLPAITFWLMGSLASVNTKDDIMLLISFLLGAIPLFLMRWRLNVLSFGDEEARALGINTERTRLVIIIGSTLLTAASVSVSGMIGWIGLVIPHFSRMLVGPNYRVLLPASALVGSAFLLAVDDLARCLFAIEIPLGILTSIIGAPFFVYLLMKGRRGWL